MEKMKMQTPDGVEMNLDRIEQLFPGCITETRDDKGNVKRAVDFDLLRQELSADAVEGPVERYQLNWPGKRQAVAAANVPINKTLRPCEKESVNFDTTGNLYIEGDNLDALKLLQETYLGKVKMIYIDPPYNTGNDFIYKDNFAADKEEYAQESGQRDGEGGRLVANPESNGRYHSDWLSMMLPRLRLAKNLLREDGVIFISIDDNEVSNLRKLCDEIFGAENFISQVPRIAKRTSDKGTHFRPTKDYVLVYAKEILLLPEFGIQKERDEAEYKFADDDGRKYKKSGASLYQPSLDPMRGCANQRYFIEAPDGSLVIPPGNVFPKNKKDGEKVKPESGDDNVWRWSAGTYLKQKHLLIFTEGSARNPLVDENGNQSKWNIYPKVYFDEDVEAMLHPEDVIYDYPNSQGTKELNALQIPFSFSKPSRLVSFLLSLIKGESSLVLDFFSGSATTAHAVMQLNAEDGGARKFIMVQLPEPCDEKSEAFKAGYKTIAEIGKERIRRAGQKIKEENATNAPNLDFGFRVLKVDSSNMKDVWYTPDQIKQHEVELFTAHIKEDRTAEDLLFQIMLDWGSPTLDAKIRKEKVGGKTVFIVNENDILACFEQGITEELVKQMAAFKPLRAVFRDDAFDDSLKINVEQIFKVLSPGTEVKSI